MDVAAAGVLLGAGSRSARGSSSGDAPAAGEDVAAAAGVGDPLQMTLGLTDGERLYAVRYASGPVANTLFHSADVESLRRLYPAAERFAHLSVGSRVVVSEPLATLPGLWHEDPAGSALVADEGRVEQFSFTPRTPG